MTLSSEKYIDLIACATAVRVFTPSARPRLRPARRAARIICVIAAHRPAPLPNSPREEFQQQFTYLDNRDR